MRPTVVPVPLAPIAPGEVPTFSVIVAAYDAAATVGEAVASALEQTAPPVEVIVCDDGSEDDLDGALEPYAGRVTLLHKDHGGAASARNAAARAAAGEFVAILDADDVYLPERLEALGELAAARPDLDILATDAHFEVDGRPAGRFNDERHPFAASDQRVEILRRNFILGNAAVRRRSLLDAGGFDESLATAEDWDCWIRLLAAGAAAGLVDEPLARYRLRLGSLTANRPQALRCRVMALEKAAARGDLGPAERAVLARSLRDHRARAELAEAEAALREGAPDARRRSLSVALGRGHGPMTRVKASMAALAPGASRRLLERRGSGSGRLVRGVEVER